jgi:hypothetical protein
VQPIFWNLNTAFIFFFCDNVVSPEVAALSLQKKSHVRDLQCTCRKSATRSQNCDTLADQKNRSTIPPAFF